MAHTKLVIGTTKRQSPAAPAYVVRGPSNAYQAHPDPRQQLLLLRTAHATRDRARLRTASLRARARADRRPHLDQAAQQSPHRLLRDGVLAVALPGLDWVTTAFEIVPLIALFELSIWLSVLFERRWRTADELAAAET